jgi:hypothetical protein
MLLSLADIQSRIEDLARRIDAPPGDLPTYGQSEDGARPHIEVGNEYYFVVVERGSELRRSSTKDLDELLYWVFSGVASKMAGQFELRNRRHGEDTRRQRFPRQIQLLNALSPAWAEKEEARLAEILSRHPFRDP